MNDRELRELSAQLMPLAMAMRSLFYKTGVHIEPWKNAPMQAGFNHEENAFTYRVAPNEGPTLVFGNLRPRAGAVWQAKLVETAVTGTELMRLDEANYPNDSENEITVEWNAVKEISEGVENVSSSQSHWELGGSVKTAVSAEAGFSAFGAEAKVSASVEAEISASGGGETGSEAHKTTETTDTEERNHSFVVAPHSVLKVAATYERGTGRATYQKRLPIDVSFRLEHYNIGRQQTYDTYYDGWFGGDGVNTPSLLDWLSGFFGESNCNDFRKGLDLSFATDPDGTQVRSMVDDLRDEKMTVVRAYSVTLSKASNFTFSTKQEAL